jgi:hypothetical protein
MRLIFCVSHPPPAPSKRLCRNRKEAVTLVIPAKAGIQNMLKILDSCRASLARNDKEVIATQSPKGDIKWFVPRWRGWPASAGRGWTLLFFVSHPPPCPLQRGTLLAVRHLSLITYHCISFPWHLALFPASSFFIPPIAPRYFFTEHPERL